VTCELCEKCVPFSARDAARGRAAERLRSECQPATVPFIGHRTSPTATVPRVASEGVSRPGIPLAPISAHIIHGCGVRWTWSHSQSWALVMVAPCHHGRHAPIQSPSHRRAALTDAFFSTPPGRLHTGARPTFTPNRHGTVAPPLPTASRRPGASASLIPHNATRRLMRQRQPQSAWHAAVPLRHRALSASVHQPRAQATHTSHAHKPHTPATRAAANTLMSQRGGWRCGRRQRPRARAAECTPRRRWLSAIP
jgi:hypothetical protein